MSRYTGTLDQPNATVTVDCQPGGFVEVLLTQPATTGATVIASGSDGVFLPQSTINVANAASLASSGTVLIVTAPPSAPDELGIEAVTYQNKTGTTLTGCAGGIGLMSTGNAVTGNKLVSWVGVDRWLTPGGNSPVLQAAANAADHLVFENVGGIVYGRHRNEPGLTGPGGTTGAHGFQNRGTYAAATAYALNDLVTYLGATYICIQAGTAQTPAAGSAYWDTVAATSGTRPPDPPPIIIIDPPPNTGDPTTSLDQPGIAARNIEWSSFTLYQYTDAQLTYMASTLGIYGLWLSNALAPGTIWTSDPAGNMVGVQDALHDSNVIARMRSIGAASGTLQKFYLGFRASIPTSTARTVFHVDWFDDAGWTNTVIPAVKNFAGAAKLLGANGVGIDNEAYAMNNGLKPSWAWDYPGNTHTEAQVRAKVKQRGAEMMAAILSMFPNVEMMVYKAFLDGGYSSLVQTVINGRPLNDFSAGYVAIDFWDGMTSVSGYSRMRFQNASFFLGTSDIGSGDLRTCLTIDVNGTLAYLSQTLSNWAYANQRVSMSPMSWLGPTNGDGPYTANNCNTAASALSLVQNMRIHGMSGEFTNFALEKANLQIPPAAQNFADFTSTNGRLNHANFVPAYAAAAPGIVDSTDPTLSGITVTRDNATTVHATGTANDNLGIRAIRWVSGPSSGAATHTFVIDGGGTYQTAYASFAWHVAWTANNIPATVGQTITFVVEDIKGRAVLYTRVAP